MKSSLIILAALALSLPVAAQQMVTTAQLDSLKAQKLDEVIDQMLHLDADKVELRLKSYGNTKQVWLRQQLIQQLGGLNKLNQQQRQWLISQVDSEHTLMAHIPDVGHHLPITVVNIPAQAKGLLAHFSALEAVRHWLSLIDNGDFQWQKVFEQSVALQRTKTALKAFLKGLGQSEQQNLINDLLTQKQDGIDPSNLLLALLAGNTDDAFQKQKLYQWLWTKPADENTIAALNKLRHEPSTLNHVALLQKAAANRELTSLSFNLLAQHFSKEPAAVEYLFGQLSNKTTGALAAAAIVQINTPEVQSRLAQGIYSPDTQIAKASRLGLSLQKTNGKQQEQK